MWELRLILILIGAVFIAAVYLLSRQKRKRPDGLRRDPPVLKEADLPDIRPDTISDPQIAPVQRPDAGVQAGDTDTGPEAESGQLILALHVSCPEQAGFAGGDVLNALQAAGLYYGQYRVFHRLTKGDRRQSIFSVASMLEPGVLDPDELPRMRIPGLTLFLVLPGPQSGVAACADMLATARSLAGQLDGELLDDNRNVLSVQAAQRIRERILAFQQNASTPSSD